MIKWYIFYGLAVIIIGWLVYSAIRHYRAEKDDIGRQKIMVFYMVLVMVCVGVFVGLRYSGVSAYLFPETTTNVIP